MPLDVTARRCSPVVWPLMVTIRTVAAAGMHTVLSDQVDLGERSA